MLPPKTDKPRVLLPSPARANWPKISPDEHWVAYSSEESGRFEVYVSAYPGPGGKRQISSGGGTYPRWRSDGKELFYVAPDAKLKAVEIAYSNRGLEVGRIQPLDIPVLTGLGDRYDVSADGQRILVAKRVQEVSSAPITLVTNWPLLLKK